jgi:membrane carboxypeptidase/penicillin-binding protein
MNPKEAKKILPKVEFEAFETILLNQISRTPSSKLKQRATLARRLRDKYIDLAHHQAAQARTRRTNEIDTDINDRRARIFQEMIDRLEEELANPRLRAAETAVRKKSRARTASTRNLQMDQRTIHEARRRERHPKLSPHS